MSTKIEHTAQAVLELRKAEIERHEADAKAWEHARTAAGPKTGDWAFASNTAETEAMAAVQRWHRERRTPTLVVSGPNGRGKSVAAARWAGRARAMFLVVTELEREGWTGGELAQMASASRALVLDNVGSERGRSRDHVTALICERHDRGVPTLITTTLLYGKGPDDPVTFASWYPESVGSRITLGFRHVLGDELRCEKDAKPDLAGIRASHTIMMAARRCRWAADGRLEPDEAAAVVEALRALLGVSPEEAEAKAAEVAQRHLDGLAFLERAHADFQRQAVAEVDARVRRIRNLAAGGEVG